MSPLTNIESLKEINSPAARMFNWNILSVVFKKFGIVIEPSVKSMLMTGKYD